MIRPGHPLLALPFLTILPWLVGCGVEPTEEPSGDPAHAPVAEAVAPGTIAMHSHGQVSLGQVEARLRGTKRQGERVSEETVGLYRRAAEALVVEHHVMDLIGDPVEALKGQGRYTGLHRGAVLEAYLRERRADVQAVSDDDARAFYDQRPERFQQVGKRLAWHIFRRDRQPSAIDETRDLLLDVRRRVRGGEPFAELARELSDSETRKVGGRLGWIPRGKLPPKLEEELFALSAGEVSEPIRVAGGAVLFHVSEAVAEKTFPFLDVRARVIEVLEQRARRELITTAVADLKPPEGSMILNAEALEAQLAAGDDTALVLETGDRRISVGTFGQLVAEMAAELPPWAADASRVYEVYEQQIQDQLLYTELVQSGWAEDAARAGAISRRVLDQGLPLLIDEWIGEQMQARLDASAEDLRAFYRDNRYLYQSPLRLELRSMSVPAAANARQVMLDMERQRQRLVAGEIDFATAGQELGADLEDLGWLDFQQLMSFAPKVRTYLLDLESVGYTIPFQQGSRLNLVWVRERQDPSQLSFEEAEEQVRQDYLERHQQPLYQQVAELLLAEHEFRFFEDAVTRALAPSDEPGEKASS